MKAPALKDLGKQAPAAEADEFSKAVEQEEARASAVVRKTFSFEQRHLDHLVTVAQQLSAERGKTIGASEALRAIIERDMKRVGQ